MNDNEMLLGGILLNDEHISNKKFNEYADKVLAAARKKAGCSDDEDESKSHDSSSRNSHNINIEDDDLEL